MLHSPPTPETILRAVCGSAARFETLRALFARPLEPQALADIARSSRTDRANALRLLRSLAEAGVVEAVSAGDRKRYRPRRGTPLFHQLLALFAPANFADAPRSSHEKLDEQKRRIGVALLKSFTLPQIRGRALENLKRWRASGVWSAAYDDWQGLLEHGTEAQLVHAMTSRDDESNRLRQSLPYVGLLDRKIVKAINEEVAS